MINVSPLTDEDQKFLRNVATLFRESKPHKTESGTLVIKFSESDRAIIIERLENLAAYGDSTAEMYGGAI
jgi:hypothetical protein